MNGFSRQARDNVLLFQDLVLPSCSMAGQGIDVETRSGKIHIFFCTNEIILNELCAVLMHNAHVQRGRVLYNGVGMHDGRRGRVRVQAVLKQANLFEELSATENIFIPQYDYFYLNRAGIKRRCKALMSQMDASAGWNVNRPVSELGQETRKLVELMRCYVSHPDVVILHETLSYLSIGGIRVWDQIIQNLRREGTIIFYLTSRVEETVYLADTVTVLTQNGSKGSFTSAQMQTDLQKIYHLMLDDEGFMSYYSDRSESEKNLLEIIDESSKFIYHGHGINNALHVFARKIQDTLKSDSCTILLLDERSGRIIDRVDCCESERPLWQIDEEALVHRLSFSEGMDSQYWVNSKMPDFAGCFRQIGDAQVLFGYGGGFPSQMRTLIATVYGRDYLCSNDDIRFLSAVAKELAIIIENSRLANRSALLFESHHRIKNNLQMVISLLLIQKMLITNEYKKHGEVPFDFYLQNIDDLFYRIKSIATIHDMISKEERSEGMVSLHEIVSRICEFYRDVAVSHTAVDEIGVPYNVSTSIALVVNELISNSIKHASCKARIEVRVAIRREEGSVALEVSDNGPGFSDPEGAQPNTGIGIKLISGIIENELHGTMERFNENGAHVRVRIPNRMLL